MKLIPHFNAYFVLNNITYYVGYWKHPQHKIQALNQNTWRYEYFSPTQKVDEVTIN